MGTRLVTINHQPDTVAGVEIQGETGGLGCGWWWAVQGSNLGPAD